MQHLNAFLLAVAAAVLVYVSISDIRERRIPNRVMLPALLVALLQMEQRIDQFRHASPVIKYTAPILFLLSDGKPEYTPELRDQEEAAMAWSKKYIKEQVAANKLVVIAVEIGRNCNHALMQELTGLRDDRHVLRADNTKSLVDFFKFSSSMLVSCSKFKNACEELNETDLRDYKNFAEQ